MKFCLIVLVVIFIPEVQAQSAGIPAISVDGGSTDGTTYSVTLEILALMTVLTLLPAILLMMTSFTRIIIVLSIPSTGSGNCADSVESDHPRVISLPYLVYHVTGFRSGIPGCVATIYGG